MWRGGCYFGVDIELWASVALPNKALSIMSPPVLKVSGYLADAWQTRAPELIWEVSKWHRDGCRNLCHLNAWRLHCNRPFYSFVSAGLVQCIAWEDRKHARISQIFRRQISSEIQIRHEAKSISNRTACVCVWGGGAFLPLWQILQDTNLMNKNLT